MDLVQKALGAYQKTPEFQAENRVAELVRDSLAGLLGQEYRNLKLSPDTSSVFGNVQGYYLVADGLHFYARIQELSGRENDLAVELYVITAHGRKVVRDLANLGQHLHRDGYRLDRETN